MESVAVLRPFYGTIQRARKEHHFPKLWSMGHINRIHLKTALWPQGFLANQALDSLLVNRKISFQPYLKASEISAAVASDAGSLEKISAVQLENKRNQKSTFPSGLEGLVLDVCDETNIAELKLKIGDFEMHLKRDVRSPKAYPHTASNIVSPTIAPPIPTEPMSEMGLVAHPPELSKPSLSPNSPFAYVSPMKESKLASLEASGTSGYVTVLSHTVGSFMGGSLLAKHKLKTGCKVGDIIKEGQIIGYLDQFGTKVPISSNVDGEVLKILFDEGDPVGYGEPIVAVLPSFHGIN
ncbi:hypothetical protein HPP92_024926 [Vanilla planifolia]|uniref:Lipoyl-binding domain-containing protein n=1 Tax=Vanilla planifolia TaxID=51239 RepID=A0A835U9Q3_VANPL|nr:hypothetical protein HPP92_024926 [Vanilla planifolia]